MTIRSARVTSLPRLGDRFAERLENLNIYTKLDLVLHLPSRYQDRTTFANLDSITVGSEHFVQGVITQVTNLHERNELLVEFADDSGTAFLRLIHFSPYIVKTLRVGSWLRVFGQLRRGRQFIHPDYRTFEDDPGKPEPHYHPIYRTTKGITSNRLSVWIKDCLGELNFLPKLQHQELTLPDALRIVHSPDPTQKLADVERARKRIAFDEMLAFTLIQRKRNIEERKTTTIALSKKTNLSEQFLGNLPFELTGSQRKVWDEVQRDLANNTAMRRLLQGDVGSGKTAIAVLATLTAAENGVQTAVMAPTEILAEQHYETFSNWLDPLGIQPTLFTSRMSARTRRVNLAAVNEGESLVAVGTHALFQQTVQFKKLGLAIIDEQHRFGVHQRMQLRGKGNNPHQFVLTATPIPRTLALTMFADMDLSIIDEMPTGRPAIHTSVHPTNQRDAIINAVRRQLKNKHQVYWVCVAIEPDDESPLQASENVLEELTHKLPDTSIGYIHGKMKTEQKSAAMQKFRTQQTQLLVATTVIEVGIDVPSASIMVIENANHLGLAQLHQLRGRIGRGSTESYCMLMYDPPLSDNAKTRLEAIRNLTDGFALAELDFKQRGHGQVFGTLQSGTEHFKTADSNQFVEQHEELSKVATQIVDTDETLSLDIIDTWTSSEPGYVAV